MSKVNVRFSFQGPRQEPFDSLRWGRESYSRDSVRQLLFCRSGSFSSGPSRAAFVSEGDAFEERRSVSALVAFASFRRVEPSLAHRRSLALRMTAEVGRSSVPGSSGFRYPTRGPPDRPNVGATFSWLRLLRQGVSLFFFTELNPLESRAAPDGSRI